jgi:hypothetical protein
MQSPRLDVPHSALGHARMHRFGANRRMGRLHATGNTGGGARERAGGDADFGLVFRL